MSDNSFIAILIFLVYLFVAVMYYLDIKQETSREQLRIQQEELRISKKLEPCITKGKE